jgi:hypothetical protein
MGENDTGNDDDENDCGGVEKRVWKGILSRDIPISALIKI